MFDRGLISLSDDLDILISRHVIDLDGIRVSINRSWRAIAPQKILCVWLCAENACSLIVLCDQMMQTRQAPDSWLSWVG